MNTDIDVSIRIKTFNIKTLKSLPMVPLSYHCFLSVIMIAIVTLLSIANGDGNRQCQRSLVRSVSTHEHPSFTQSA